jgi:thiopurine S-methyltransferase
LIDTILFHQWEDNRTGWHEQGVNQGLMKYGEQYIFQKESCPSDGLRWFVPLCGKTVDLAYLAGHESTAQVVGLDGVRKALDEFCQEHEDLGIKPNSIIQSSAVAFDRLSGKKITLLKGDYFAVTDEATDGKFDAVLDRASLVAIDPSLRDAYVETLGRLLKPGAKILLVTLDRRTGDEEAIKQGPPFSVSEETVRALYEGKEWVKSVTFLEEIDAFARTPEDKERYQGVTSLYELYMLIEVKE